MRLVVAVQPIADRRQDSGVDAEDGAPGEGWLGQQAAQVGGEDPHRVVLGGLAQAQPQIDGEAGAGITLGETWSLRPAARLEWVRHDEPDSVVDFDYAVASAQLALAREIGPGWRVSGGVRSEWLVAPWNSAEEYGEIAAVAEVERFTGGSMWSLAPAAGRRDYARSAATATSGGLLAPLLHSDFRFVDVTALLDQPLPARLRLRVTGAARAEWHDLDAYDARSLYFSCDVRRLF